jgi:osmotically-inducible protein OsmY
VAGVLAVANDIEVRLPLIHKRPGRNCARRGLRTESATAIPLEGHPGSRQVWVTLEGQVDWNYQRARAEEAARCNKGVKGITNLIRLQPRVTALEVKSKIEEAFLT